MRSPFKKATTSSAKNGSILDCSFIAASARTSPAIHTCFGGGGGVLETAGTASIVADKASDRRKFQQVAILIGPRSAQYSEV
jgi:hypothetical protein